MLKEGVGVNKQDKDGKTALMWAAGKFQPKCLETLLMEGADVNMRSFNGETVLHYLFKERCSDTHHNRIGKCLKVLLSRGAKMNKVDYQGRNVVMLNSALHLGLLFAAGENMTDVAQ